MKYIIAFIAISAVTLLAACGGGGGGGGGGSNGNSNGNSNGGAVNNVAVKASTVSNAAPMATGVMRTISYATDGAPYADSPFAKIEGVGFGAYPYMAAYSIEGQSISQWSIMGRKVFTLKTDENNELVPEQAFVSEGQSLSFASINEFRTAETYGGQLTLEPAPESFRIDYMFVGLGRASIYGKDASGEGIYAPFASFCMTEDPALTGKVYKTDYRTLGIGADYIHPAVPDAFKSYKTHLLSGFYLRTSNAADVVYSANVGSAMYVDVKPAGTAPSTVTIIYQGSNTVAQAAKVKADFEAIFNAVDAEGYRLDGGSFAVFPMNETNAAANVPLTVNVTAALDTADAITVTLDLQKAVAVYCDDGSDVWIHSENSITPDWAPNWSPERPAFGAKVTFAASILK